MALWLYVIGALVHASVLILIGMPVAYSLRAAKR